MRLVLWLLLSFMATYVTAQEYHFRQIPIDYNHEFHKINLLFQSKDHMIWLGTDRGLYSFDGRKYRFVPRPDGVSQNVSAITENEKGEIWTGYDDGMIHTLDKGISRMIDSDSIGNFPLSKIIFRQDGSIYFATYGNGMWIMHGDQFSRVQYETLNQKIDIYDALIDQKDRLWIGTDHGVWIYTEHPKQELRNLTKADGLPDEIVTKLMADRNGDIWIGFYDHGVGRYSISRDKIISVIDQAPRAGSVVSLMNGITNDIWYGTENSIGRYSFSTPGRFIRLPVELKENIEDILIDKTGNLWIATGDHLWMANTQLEEIHPGIKGIQSIASGPNHLWLGCEKGLYSYNRSFGDVSKHLAEKDLNILSIYIDSLGILWIGTFGDGLYIYDPETTKVKNLKEEDGISNNSILNISGRGQHVWLATLGGITELISYQHPVEFKPAITDFQKKYNFPAAYVYDVFIGKDGKAWFGTDGKGLYHLDDNRLVALSPQIITGDNDTFDIRTIYSITGDDLNHIWVSGTKGNILRLDTAGNLIKHISTATSAVNSLITSGKNEIVVIREGVINVYNELNGLFSFSASTGLISFLPNINANVRDADGSVWIADTEKIIHYIPSWSDTSKYVHMHLVDMAPGIMHDEGSIRLKPDSNFLDIRFTGLWYPDPVRVQYRYKLEGHDLDWIYTQEGRAVYSKLSPGTYTFMVEGSHTDNFDQSHALQRRIIVLPPFYLTWWFIAGMISLITFLAVLFFRARIQRIQRIHNLEREKTTLQLHAIQAQVNPHFLFNSFNTLSNIIEEDQEAAVDYVDQLSGFFRGVLMYRNAEVISLEEEINIMRNYIYILKKRHGDNICIEEHIDTKDGFIAPLTIQLLIENAIKHNKVSGEKPLHISISLTDDWVTVSNPMQPKIQVMNESTGFGLSSLLTRYQYLTPVKIEIRNDGNTFTVRIPVVHPNHAV